MNINYLIKIIESVYANIAISENTWFDKKY